MLKFRFVVVVCAMSIMSVLNSSYVLAASNNLVVSQVQTRSLTGGTAYEELIEVYNNSDLDIDITNWCLKYGSTGNPTPTKPLVCFTHSTPLIGNYVFIPGHSSILTISKAFADAFPGFGHDLLFSSGISDNERWISISDNNNLVVDMVEWGTAGFSTTAEGNMASVAPNSSQIIQRKMINPGKLIDTDNNLNDFELVSARTIYPHGLLYEIEDYCLNIDGIQSTIPNGYDADKSRNCSLAQIDVCPNVDGLQITTPEGYHIDDSKNCMLDILTLNVTELLPNPLGADDGGEFIEIYNPNLSDVSLENYNLFIGDNNIKYNFPAGSTVRAGQYMSFTNNEIKFTLLNTISHATLKSIDGQIIDVTPNYNNPKEGYSWAVINDIWKYTNRPTPGSVNLDNLVESSDDAVKSDSGLAPCGVNQYRSPETNRCRNIIESTSTLVPCKDGQYRSEETNRCRNIVPSAALTPCAEGQERNPETNRCRSIASTLGVSNLAPCKEGQERNPETNRCRNIVSAMPLVDYAPEQTHESSNNYILWWSLSAVGLVAAGYGVWEWRKEITNLIKNKLFKRV